MSLAAKAAAFGSFELTVCAAPSPFPIGLLRSTYGEVALPFGILGPGDARVGAGTPFAVAVKVPPVSVRSRSSFSSGIGYSGKLTSQGVAVSEYSGSFSSAGFIFGKGFVWDARNPQVQREDIVTSHHSTFVDCMLDGGIAGIEE